MGRVTIPLEVLDTLKDPATLRFFLWCLIQAATKEAVIVARGQTITLSPGEFIFNRRKAANALESYGLSERKIRTALDKCKASQYVSQKTSQKVTVISVMNFATYDIIAERGVPESVPESVPKRRNKSRQPKDNNIPHRTTRNTRNTNNKEKHSELRDSISQVFHHYRKTNPTFGRTVRPGHKDWTLIGDRLKDNYSVEECQWAINGNSVDPWYKSKGLHSIKYIFKDAAFMDRFITTWQQHHRPVISEKAQRGIQATQAWLARKENTNG
jgi:hypothetical protein|tara:strand:+ start:1572 stop:2381 length:810 start_codon:yes stop_codon:yes gene_type:complete